jgi:hypothetical protein
MSFAFVRWYSIVKQPRGAPTSGEARDVLAKHGYTKLQWDAGRQYEVVPLASVARRCYVVPDFKTDFKTEDEATSFYVSLSKWDRVVKDTSNTIDQRGDEEGEGGESEEEFEVESFQRKVARLG